MKKAPDVFDIAIIGGGLAGLTLAIQLAKADKSVILFEKETYPFHKVCGEYISMESWDFLQRCGLDLEVMNLPKLTKLKVSAPNGNFIDHALDPGGFGISRHTLDFKLATIAKSLGVIVMDATKVDDVLYANDRFTVIADQELYYAKVVSGTFGKRSNIDVKLNRKFIQTPKPSAYNYIGVKYHIRLDFPDDVIELHNFSDGYCGISKVDDGRYCLCYMTTARNLQKYGTIKNMEEQLLIKNPYLKRYFSEAEFLYQSPLSISQISFSSKKTVENHMLMAGDAAGLIAPLCGNGMSMAMHSSFFAYGLIIKYLDGEIDRGELELQYAKLWKREFSVRLFAGRLIQYSFGRPEITNRMIGLLKKFPSIVNQLVKLTHGQSF